MNTHILPICPFGNVKWWSIFIGQSEENNVLLNSHENFQKQTWRNRYEILGANGKLSLTVPISKESGKKIPTSEIELFTDPHWKKVHWRSIKSAYGSSPFWIYYSDQLETIFNTDFKLLSEFSEASILFIIEELQLDLTLTYASKKLSDEIDRSTEFKPSKCSFENDKYLQVFSDRFDFHENLSILDLLFNLGPEAESYLMSVNSQK